MSTTKSKGKKPKATKATAKAAPKRKEPSAAPSAPRVLTPPDPSVPRSSTPPTKAPLTVAVTGDADPSLPDAPKVADGADLSFAWLVRDHGADWEDWRSYIATYLNTVDAGLADRFQALRLFCLRYLLALKLPPSPTWFVDRRTAVPEVFPAIHAKKTRSTLSANNYISDFIDWLLVTHYSLPDDYGRPVVSPEYHNPVPRMKHGRGSNHSESVHSALPYAYLTRLREILAPGAHFRDWTWAQQALGIKVDEDGNSQSGRSATTGDWFEVDPSLIDPDDMDCVWRTRKLGQRVDPVTRKVTARNLTVTEIWSPTRSVALLTKLHVPLRNSQVRWLDSGEADTWRYQTTGRDGPERGHPAPGEPWPVDWVLNTGPLAEGDERHPVQRGVFRRIEDREFRTRSTGLFVNTNKTADADVDGDDKGYLIPWQKDDLLYWLEKLRNWQAKYNPIDAPVAWSTLEKKHLSSVKSAAALARYADTCFLFRDAAATGEGRSKPIHNSSMDNLWYLLLKALQDEERAKGTAYTDGRPIQFVKDRPEGCKLHSFSTTLFPLHSLRVSLLTCLALDGEVPLPVLSKLVAGHARLIMTIYYQKVTPYRVSELLVEAQKRMQEGSPESVRRFLAEESFRTLAERLVMLDQASFRSALGEEPGDRVPAGWMPVPIGWCLAGGNTSPSEVNAQLPGCYNGGGKLQGGTHGIHSPVHGGPRNCVACRWLVTGPQYLAALCARANEIALQLSDASQVLIGLEQQATALRREAYQVERRGELWTRAQELSDLVARYERQASVVDSHGTTLAYAWRLIIRCLRVAADSDGKALVATGQAADVQLALREVDSRMLQIHRVCMDAEIQPDIEPGEALFVRSQWIDAALDRDGHHPVMFSLTKDQQLKIGNRLLDDLGEQHNPDDPELGREEVLLAIEHGDSLAELGLYGATMESLNAIAAEPTVHVGSHVTQ
ncbi:MAG: integrase family protein, partial [Rhodanobacteraceae bacterium]|nr:integrase family protein [Rhodanobacteraceae bacterium]